MNSFSQTLYILLSAMLSSYSCAGIMASSTRIIYQETDHDKSIMLANTNAYPILTQVWVDDGSNNPDFTETPFVVLPAIFQMSASEIKGLRFIYNQMPLATQKESVFWLNLYEIPAIKKTQLQRDYLNLAMNTQLKVFFRPKALKAPIMADLAKSLSFKIITQNRLQYIQVINPSPYHISLIKLSISNGNNQSSATHPDMMIAPMQSKLFSITDPQATQPTKSIEPIKTTEPQLKDIKNITIRYVLIDDHGKSHNYVTALQ